jgi:rhodanese-related sulfurtransferase
MAWPSFLQNLLGGADDTVDTTEPGSGPRRANLSGPAFKKQLNETPNAVLLDVRTPDEFAGGTIPGALNVDFFSTSFTQKVDKLDKSATYFVFCRSGNRSGQACKIMHQMGFDVRNLSGGIGAYPF